MTRALTDSGTQRAIEDAAERGAARALEISNTPPVGTAMRSTDSGTMYEVAERVVACSEARAHLQVWAECPVLLLKKAGRTTTWCQPDKHGDMPLLPTSSKWYPSTSTSRRTGVT